MQAGRCGIPAQAIESRGTQISYAALLYAMTEALEQLAASQGKVPPKLPAEMSGLFGGILDRLVRCLFNLVVKIVKDITETQHF